MKSANTQRFTKLPRLTLLAAIAFSLMFGGSVSAFTDVKGDPEQKSIERLENQGIFKGDGKGQFMPLNKMNSASAVTLIVNALDLNLDTVRFLKQPKASDYFTKVKDNVWYSEAFIIASYYELGIPKDINPATDVTREQFSHWLFNALSTKGNYVWSQLSLGFKDSQAVNTAYMDSVQKLLNAKIAKLDIAQSFRPTQPITRSEAAGLIDRTLQFIEGNTVSTEPSQEEGNSYSATLSSEPVSGDINLVTVTATVPHPGYGIEISNITFADGKALVKYRISPPDRNKIFPQVITKIKATTYVSSSYQPVLDSLNK